MTPAASTYGEEAARDFSAAAEPRALDAAVVRFHRRMDEVLAQSLAAHAVTIDCRAGCSLCCGLRVEVQPAEAFHLASWLRRRLAPAALEAVLAKLRHNVAVTAAMGVDARSRSNLPCALLDTSGRCSAYEARPAQCRRFHSTRLATCEASHARPWDDTIESPMHPAVAHNGAVIAAQAREAQRAAGLDAAPLDLNRALLDALANPKAWRRWRDGKKAFPT
jgi:Fe-S-cluster containining protein